MAVLGIDLGGTKIAFAVFSETGILLSKEIVPLKGKQGAEVSLLIVDKVKKYVYTNEEPNIQSIAVSVPGISRVKTGTVWAPNIPGWDDYPLLADLKKVSSHLPVAIDSDRACYMLGELWQGNAKGLKDAIYLSVGTGIGAGILVNGNILRGAHDIAGAIGWMALEPGFKEKYISCGHFEYHASGEGIARVTKELLVEKRDYTGSLRNLAPEKITADQVFSAYEKNDSIAVEVIEQCIVFWGMGVANLISLFNPEKIIFGGGVFGPAVKFLPAIRAEAAKWAQPVAVKLVSLEPSGLGGDAGVYGAGLLALKNIYPA